MSSKNSAICPQCHKRNTIERATHRERINDAYGVLSKHDYEALKKEMPPKLEDETMGEYYEWEFTSDGKFWFSFHFSCDVCGFYWGHKGETNYPLNMERE
jgi:hypothetical protein